MHTPEHMMNQMTQGSTAILAAGTLVYAATRARGELLTEAPDRSRAIEPRAVVPRNRIGMVAAVTALIFATQMMNFPVSVGTSGHLVGGALAAALLGPWTGLLSIATVLAVQALVFADGGVGALGVNVTTMGIVAIGVGWAVTSLIMRRARASRSSLTMAAAAGALVSVPAAALAFVGLYAVGGQVPVSLGALSAQMVGVHLLIGLGEAAITGLIVAAVLAIDPSMAYAGRRFGVGADARARSGLVLGGAGVVAVVTAVALSRFASASPDGLDFVSKNLGLDVAGGMHAISGSVLAEYGAAGSVDVGVAGLIGVVVVAAMAFGLMWVIGRRDCQRPQVRIAKV